MQRKWQTRGKERARQHVSRHFRPPARPSVRPGSKKKKKRRERERPHHTEQPCRVVRQVKVLVFKLGAVDTLAAGPVAVDKVAALDHEMGDHSAGVRDDV